MYNITAPFHYLYGKPFYLSKDIRFAYLAEHSLCKSQKWSPRMSWQAWDTMSCKERFVAMSFVNCRTDISNLVNTFSSSDSGVRSPPRCLIAVNFKMSSGLLLIRQFNNSCRLVFVVDSCSL